MASPQITPTAQLAPGVCFMSGDNAGPFIDTGRTLRRHGRVYLSLKHLGSVLRAAGWLTAEDTKDLREEIKREAAKALAASESVALLEDLIEAITPFVPAPAPVERQVLKVEVRDPTAADIQAFLDRNPQVMARYKPAEPGSAQEWNALYRPKTTPGDAPAPVEAPATPSGDASGGEEPSATAELHGQEVNLDEVLDHSVDDVLLFAEGNEGLHAPLVAREQWRAGQRGDKPRVTLVRALSGGA